MLALMLGPDAGPWCWAMTARARSLPSCHEPAGSRNPRERVRADGARERRRSQMRNQGSEPLHP